MLTPEQLRMARAALKLSVKAAGDLAGVDKGTVVRAEAGKNVYVRTLETLREALEKRGVVFIDAREGVHGAGVALACNVVVDSDDMQDDGAPPSTHGGLANCAWDDEDGPSRHTVLALPNDPDLRDLYGYWREHRVGWQGLSDPSRRAVLREIFGELPDRDPIIDHP